MKKILILFIVLILLTPTYGDVNLFENHGSIMLIIDPDNGSIVFANLAASNFYLYSIDELLTMKISDINVLNEQEVKKEMTRAKLEDRNYFNFIHQLKDGSQKHVEVYSYPISYMDKDMLFSIVIDITEEVNIRSELVKEHNENIDLYRSITISILVVSLIGLVLMLQLYKKNILLNKLTQHDTLTGVFNRRHIRDIYIREIAKENLPLGFFMIDVNNLKFINDVYGHKSGDEMIIKVTDMIREKVFDDAYIGRVSGDEFVIIISNCGNACADRIEMDIKNSIINIHGIHFNVSVGKILIHNQLPFEDAFAISERLMYQYKIDNKDKQNKRILRELRFKYGFINADYEKRLVLHKKVLLMLASQINLSRSEIENIELALEYRDLGELVYDDLRHVESTFTILHALGMPHAVVMIAYHHHETFDGSGYPHQLKGLSIPYGARVLRFVIDLCHYKDDISQLNHKLYDPSLNSLINETLLKDINTL